MDFDDVFVPNSDKTIGHLGLVAGSYDELHIGTIIDHLIPKNGPHTLSHGDIVKAMTINGLGYIERRLYLFPAFFTDLSLKRLFNKDITADHLNDDVIGRTLDAIAAFGPTELFNHIVSDCLERDQFAINLVNTDTTNFSVYGDYDSDTNTEEIEITYGHPKDGRWDLKRFVLGMATNQYGIPLMLQTFSGNESDKKSLLRMVTGIKENLKIDEKVLHVADAAFYTEENLQTLGIHTFWISRVPMVILEADELRRTEEPFITCSDDRYSYYSSFSNYAGIRQKWFVFHSSEQQKRKESTFEKKIEKELDKSRKSLKHLASKRFACEPDAQNAINDWIVKHPWIEFDSCSVKQVHEKIEKKRGRPTKDETLIVKYAIEGGISLNKKYVERERAILGRFIVATNDLDLDPESALSYYKGQYQVEKGFKFLKDKTFRVSEVFLKNIGRIQALAMIMVLCLYVYAVSEYKLRKGLKESNESVPSQTGKPTQNPTMRWVFFLFRRVRELSLKIEGKVVTKVLNLDETIRKIVKQLGPEYEKYYFY
ncbi:IS1634 family transposase [Methanospirillum lacunae]|uniref:IS1634 family transposase n=1 Tax=Methanospirillum lacunae TaxID=668570 RepID=UPI0038FCB352